MYLSPEVVGKEFIVLRSQEASDPHLLTDGQLLTQLTQVEQEKLAWGENVPIDTRQRLTSLLNEVRRRCLVAAARSPPTP